MGDILNPNPRQSGSGRFRTDLLKFAVDPAVGDVPLLTSAGWVGTPIAGIGAYDFVLRSRADLLAVPGLGAGPLYTLPSGAYMLKAGFALVAGEGLVVPAAANVQFDGQLGAQLVGTPGANPLVDVAAGGFLQSRNLSLETNSNGSQAIRCAGNVDLSNCSLDAATTGGVALEVTGGDVSDQGSRLLGGTGAAISQTGGITRLVQTIAQAGGSGLSLSGAVGLLSTCMGCTFIGGTTAPAVDHQASAGQLELDGSWLFVDQAGSHGLNIAGALSCLVRGGRIESTAGAPGSGVRVNGAITEGLEVNGTRLLNFANGVLWVAGAVNRAALIGLDGAANVVVGVDWAAADIPTNGLLELGCQFNTATPFANHTAADARVNRKACTAAGALVAETAIVP